MAEQKQPVTDNKKQQKEEGVNYQNIIFQCINKWYWLLSSVAICLIIALLYIKMTPPTYQHMGSVLIKEDKRGKSIANSVSELSDLGIMGSRSNVQNEMLTIKSPLVITRVVKQLGLELNYYQKGTFYDKTLYGETLPFTIAFLDDEKTTIAGIFRSKNGKFLFKLKNVDGEKVSEEIKGNVSDTVYTHFGRVVVSPNPKYVVDPKAEPVDEILVTKVNVISAIGYVKGNMDAEMDGKESSVINIVYQDVNRERVDDVINSIIEMYNESWILEKNEIAVNTSKFIDERLEVIQRELGSVDSDISTYKSQNLIPDANIASGLYFKKTDATGDALLELSNRKAMAGFIRQQLTSHMNKNQLLPANSGIENSSIEKLIAEYNSDLLQRNSIAQNSNEQNPIVVEFDQKIAQERSMILASLDNYIHNLNNQISSTQQSEAKSTSQLAASPSQAKYLLSVERQQKVKESLYLFLLQKREENEIGQAFTAYNTRILQPAMGSPRPISPEKTKILLIACAIGLVIPIGIIYLLETLNNRVRGKKDLEDLNIPYIGEIPLASQKKHQLAPFITDFLSKIFIKEEVRLKRQEKADREARKVVVSNGGRDFVNEAFRVVRVNLEFMLKNTNKVIMTSSINPGSGKTFLAMNLAMSFAIKQKKVAVVDLDLRKGNLSQFVGAPKVGVANFLNGEIKDYHDVIIKSDSSQNIDVIPCGILPPNPAELLYDERLEKMIEQLRNEYDIVFLDCPPVDMLADASIVNKFVDLTLFIIRAELLERSMLPTINRMYEDNKYKNMALILNGTTATYGSHGYNKYGYGYGYGYENVTDKKIVNN